MLISKDFLSFVVYMNIAHQAVEVEIVLDLFRVLRRMPCCASALLMGCSSGSLRKAGEYEPSGPVLAYLMAGKSNALCHRHCCFACDGEHAA